MLNSSSVRPSSKSLYGSETPNGSSSNPFRATRASSVQNLAGTETPDKLPGGPLVLWPHTNAVHVSKHEHPISVVHHELARTHNLPQRNPHALSLVPVVFTHHLLDGLGGLPGIVEGNTQHVVVEHMGLDDIVENVLTNEPKITIDGSSSTTGKSPLLLRVVGHGGVGVLEESDKHKPVVDPEPWEKPVHQNGKTAKRLNSAVDTEDHAQNANVTEHNVPELVLLENGRFGRIVGLGPPGNTGNRLACGVGGQVELQAAELLENKNPQCPDWRLLQDFTDLARSMALNKFLLGVGNENHVSGQMARGLVVFGVGEFPREVGHAEVRVEHPADEIVDVLVVRKRPVATFVGQNPESKAKKPN